MIMGSKIFSDYITPIRGGAYVELGLHNVSFISFTGTNT
jgi:hypothetical protein